METSEKDLVKNAQKHPEQFGILFDRYYDQIFKYILKRTAHVQAAQDITAEVFFKAYRKLWQFKWQGNPFSSWLYRIATNEVNTYFKKNKTAPIPSAFMEELAHLSIFLDSPETDLMFAQDDLVEKKKLIDLHEAVQNLPIKYQEVLALRYFEEKAILEICQILGKKEGTVKSLISRGIRLLEQKMQPSVVETVLQAEPIINYPHHEQTRN